MAKDRTFDQIEKDVEKAAEKALIAYSEEISKKMYDCYKRTIDIFYKDYTPKYYRRTYSLYEAATNSPFHGGAYKSQIFNLKKSGSYLNMKITMDIDGKYIEGNPYHADFNPYDPGAGGKEWVFERSYGGFIHGFTRTENRNTWLHGNPTYYDTGRHINRWGNLSRWIPRKTEPKIGVHEYDMGYSTAKHFSGFISKKGKLNIQTDKMIKDLNKTYIKNNAVFDNFFNIEMRKMGLYQ